MATIAVYTNFGGHIVKENRGGTKRGYVPDPLGSTVALVDTAGASTDTWKYWPYGEVESHTGLSTTPFTFVGTLGYFRDLVSKLTYVRARYYQALIGQWMTMDPLWPLTTSFRYCISLPVLLIDYKGAEPRFPFDEWFDDSKVSVGFALLAVVCAFDIGFSAGCLVGGSLLPDSQAMNDLIIEMIVAKCKDCYESLAFALGIGVGKALLARFRLGYLGALLGGLLGKAIGKDTSEAFCRCHFDPKYIHGPMCEKEVWHYNMYAGQQVQAGEEVRFPGNPWSPVFG